MVDGLCSVAQVRSREHWAMETLGLAGDTLMERAGAAAFASLRRHWPDTRSIAVACGVGNNAGDGFVVARLAREAGLEAEVLLAGDPARLQGDAATNLERWRGLGGPVRAWSGEAPPAVDVLVDALFGIGLDRPVSGVFAACVEALDAAPAPVLALDVPSGLDADGGEVLGAAVHAAATVTFIAPKRGLFTGDGPDCAGAVECSDLGLPADRGPGLDPVVDRLDAGLLDALPPRPRNSHKGLFGHVLVVGGNVGMGGAARMAAEAALRAGAGRVSVATHPDHAATLGIGRPELMVHGIDNERALIRLLARASVVAVGPGLGLDGWTRTVWRACWGSELPLVVDADALGLLPRRSGRDALVLTPHPGESRRMLEGEPAPAHRFEEIERLHALYGGTVVLKGCGSLVADAEGGTALCEAGNAGMSTGGTGDLLTGVIAALMAQGLPPGRAARAGVWAHATAGDRAAADGERGMAATDLLPHLRAVLNP